MGLLSTKVSKRNFLGVLATVAAAGWYYQSTGEESPSPDNELTMSYDAAAMYDSIIRKRTKSELPAPPEEAPAFAITDAGAYEWPAEGSEWYKLPLGTKADPLAPIRTIHERIKERSVFGHSLDDFAAGRVSESRWASWPMQMSKHLASYPVNKSTPVLMFHSEGSYPAEYTKTFPRMKERGIPWMMAATPDRIGTGLEHSQLVEMMMHGCEVGLYTADGGHLDEHVEDLGDLEEILLDQKRALEQMGFPVQHMMPRKGSGINTNQIDDAKSYMTRTAFTASGHGYASPASDGPRAVGNVAHHGTASIKIEDDDMTASEAKQIIDRLTKTTDRLRFFFHTHKIEDWDRMEAILDHAVQKRAAGALDLATSTGGLLIPWDLPAGNVVNDSDASFAATWENGVGDRTAQLPRSVRTTAKRGVTTGPWGRTSAAKGRAGSPRGASHSPRSFRLGCSTSTRKHQQDKRQPFERGWIRLRPTIWPARRSTHHEQSMTRGHKFMRRLAVRAPISVPITVVAGDWLSGLGLRRSTSTTSKSILAEDARLKRPSGDFVF